MLCKLNQYIEEGWVISQKHPTLPLTIYNYSQETQYAGKWDEITLMCRGLVLDNNTGEIVARPFSKFFNWEEVVHSVTAEQLAMDFEVYDKMDGSLGIVFTYAGELVFATRGSFTSDQAIRATKIAEKYRMTLITDKDLYESTNFKYSGDSLTLLFEIVYPENRIVVDYKDREDLVLLGVIHTKSGEELSYDSLSKISEILNCPLVKRYEGLNNFETIKALNWDNYEGMVIRFSNGYRMKIKFSDYIALHRIMTGCSSYDVWENLMMFGRLPEELLTKVPDEFYFWIKTLEVKLRGEYQKLLDEYECIFKQIMLTPRTADRKTFAAAALKHKHSSILFNMLDGREPRDLIWRLIKPAYSKPFADKG